MTSGVEVPGVSEALSSTPGSVWALCYDDYLDRVRTHLRDNSKQFVSDKDIIDSINEARLDLAWRYRAIKGTTSGTFAAANGAIDVSGLSMFEPEVLRINATGATPYEVEFVADDVWFSYVDVAAIPNKAIGRFEPSTITVYPFPSMGAPWRMNYVAKPRIIGVGDCDTLPDVLQRRAIAYARAQAKMKLNEIAEAQMFKNEYLEGLPNGDVNQLYTSRGPLQLIPTPGVFDSDPDAAHR